MKKFFGVLVAGLLSLAFSPPGIADDDVTAHLVNRPGAENWAVWGEGQRHHFVRDDTVAGQSALHVDIAGPRKNPWDIQAHADITDDIDAGDTVTAAFWARAKSNGDQARAHVTASIHANGAPYTPIGQAQIEIGSRWTLYLVAGKAAAAFAARHAGVTLQLAGERQIVEIGPLFVALNDTRTPAAMKSVFKHFRFATTIEDVVIHDRATDIDLAATFRSPRGKGPFPAVLLVTGHGPQTRGGFRLMSDTLVQHGIATLEYDKRGCGESTGTFATATLSDLIGDATAAAAFLRSRPEVARKHVGLLGASEGAIIVPAMAAKDPSFAFTVLIGVSAMRAEDIALDQWEAANRAQGLSEDKIDRGRTVLRRLYDAVIAAKSNEEARAGAKAVLALLIADKSITREQADQMAAELAARPMRELLAWDAQVNLHQVKVPVLALIGSLDLQVPAGKNLPLLRQALAGNPDVTAMELPGLNHNLQKAKTGTTDEWATLGMPFSDQPTLELIAHWIDKHLDETHEQ
jgi:uncharacterized protein